MIASSFRLCSDEKEFITNLSAKISRLMNLRNKEISPGEAEEIMLLVEEVETLALGLSTSLKNPIPMTQIQGMLLLEDRRAATLIEAKGDMELIPGTSEGDNVTNRPLHVCGNVDPGCMM